MKKVLLATSAIVAAGFITTASAAEWSSSVNGYWFVGAAVSDSDDNQDGFGVLRDGEISFNAKLKADNGLTFGSRVELEAFTSGDQIDENYATIGGSFGTIKIGSDDDASYNSHVGTIYAPGARIGYYDTFIINPRNGSEFVANSNASDQIGIHYGTPNFNGFQANFSYIPRGNTDGAGDTNNVAFNDSAPGVVENIFSVGAYYQGDFDGFGFGISGGYTDGSGQNDIATFGANIGAAGFKIAGTYEADGTEEFAIGVQYSNGPITVGGGYTFDDVSGGAVTDDVQVAAGWLTYAIAPGVSGTVGLEYTDNSANNQTLGAQAFLALSF